ncbi:hypothetical protein MOD83_10180 [Bacillus haynesii]|uniref:hypothetical protein n=1 Tax=Bacillus haynesii TaxID=1925021 RepID=UPI0022823E8F|nr:hypothetical protein [Bacillus haynesii]MCY8671558.1 hypothetical protein [Bacillus haynesii]
MIKKQFLSAGLFLGFLLLITGCKDQSSTKYEVGFPKEDSPALMEFMRNKLDDPEDITLSHQDHTYIKARNNKDGFRYFKYTEEQLKSIYQPMFSAKNPSKKLYELQQGDLEKNGTIIRNPVKQNLPDMKIINKNVLKVKTNFGEKEITLTPDAKEVYFDLRAVNNKSMAIEITDQTKGIANAQTYYLFLKQDLSKYQMIKEQDLNKDLESGKLTEYIPLFPKVSSEGAYVKLFDRSILNTKTNKITKIKKTDYLSKDGRYVYIDGRKDEISSGEQKIQTVKNYVEGTNEYEAEFTLDFDSISKEMEFKTSGVGSADINYFNKDYVVLSVSYNGIMVGTAGHINVIIDLQKNKNQPTSYLVDLGIE